MFLYIISMVVDLYSLHFLEISIVTYQNYCIFVLGPLIILLVWVVT